MESVTAPKIGRKDLHSHWLNFSLRESSEFFAAAICVLVALD
jgi:hypothetical protein